MSILMMTLAQTTALAHWSGDIWKTLVQEEGAKEDVETSARGRPLGGGPLPRDGTLPIAWADAAEQAAIGQAAVAEGAMREVDRGARAMAIAEEAWAEQAAIILQRAAGEETAQTVASATILRQRAPCHVALRDGREFGEGSSISWFQTVPTCQRLCAEVKAGYVALRNGWAFGEGSSISWVQTVLTYQRLCVELVAEEADAVLRLPTEAVEVLGRL